MASPTKNTNPTDTQTKTDAELAAGYTSAIEAAKKAEQVAADLQRTLKQQAEVVAANAEERRRVQDKALYDLGVERQKVKDQQEREDEERNKAFLAREQAVKEAESEILTLLKLQRNEEDVVPEKMTIREAFAARIAEVEKTAEARGKAVADAAAQQKAALDEAKGSTAGALLKQENDQLKVANAALVKQNADLLANQQKIVGDMKDVANNAFTAAGGVVAQGNGALATSAGAMGPRATR